MRLQTLLAVFTALALLLLAGGAQAGKPSAEVFTDLAQHQELLSQLRATLVQLHTAAPEAQDGLSPEVETLLKDGLDLAEQLQQAAGPHGGFSYFRQAGSIYHKLLTGTQAVLKGDMVTAKAALQEIATRVRLTGAFMRSVRLFDKVDPAELQQQLDIVRHYLKLAELPLEGEAGAMGSRFAGAEAKPATPSWEEMRTRLEAKRAEMTTEGTLGGDLADIRARMSQTSGYKGQMRGAEEMEIQAEAVRAQATQHRERLAELRKEWSQRNADIPSASSGAQRTQFDREAWTKQREERRAKWEAERRERMEQRRAADL